MSRDHPRTRGEYPINSFTDSGSLGSPPHTRGILKLAWSPYHRNGITPAHAGNTCLRTDTTFCWRDHPRTRGEYVIIPISDFFRGGSPPHTRGIRTGIRRNLWWCGITPAHAGNTCSGTWFCVGIWDHPRTRGEYSNTSYLKPDRMGSPPHTRGIL